MEPRDIKKLERFSKEVRESMEQTRPPPAPNKNMVDALEAFGRERLSKHYFMRDFLYSEIAAVHGITNVPDDPKQAIEAGKGLCGHLLEPLRDIFGHITIRSAFRSTTVNGYGNKHRLNCARNERNFAGHIWDHRDADGCLGRLEALRDCREGFLKGYSPGGSGKAIRPVQRPSLSHYRCLRSRSPRRTVCGSCHSRTSAGWLGSSRWPVWSSTFSSTDRSILSVGIDSPVDVEHYLFWSSRLNDVHQDWSLVDPPLYRTWQPFVRTSVEFLKIFKIVQWKKIRYVVMDRRYPMETVNCGPHAVFVFCDVERRYRNAEQYGLDEMTSAITIPFSGITLRIGSQIHFTTSDARNDPIDGHVDRANSDLLGIEGSADLAGILPFACKAAALIDVHFTTGSGCVCSHFEFVSGADSADGLDRRGLSGMRWYHRRSFTHDVEDIWVAAEHGPPGGPVVTVVQQAFTARPAAPVRGPILPGVGVIVADRKRPACEGGQHRRGFGKLAQHPGAAFRRLVEEDLLPFLENLRSIG